jgi:hypothetical protein
LIVILTTTTTTTTTNITSPRLNSTLNRQPSHHTRDTPHQYLIFWQFNFTTSTSPIYPTLSLSLSHHSKAKGQTHNADPQTPNDPEEELWLITKTDIGIRSIRAS